MKSILILLLFSCLSFLASAHSPNSPSAVLLTQLRLQIELTGPIQWKVGDRMEYQIIGAVVGKIGTMTTEITGEEGDAIWFKQKTLIVSKLDIQEMLINRADGKLLKYLKNGKISDYQDDPLQITSQNEESVKVPAGTFRSLHLIGKTNRSPHVEIWSNPDLTAMDGMIKTLVGSGIGNVIQLTKFVRAP